MADTNKYLLVKDTNGNSIKLTETPSNVSEFTNDAGYITEAAIPTTYFIVSDTEPSVPYENMVWVTPDELLNGVYVDADNTAY